MRRLRDSDTCCCASSLYWISGTQAWIGILRRVRSSVHSCYTFFKQTPTQTFRSQQCRMKRCQLKHRDLNACLGIVENCLFCPTKFSRDGKNVSKKRGTKLVSYANRSMEDEIRERYGQNRPRALHMILYREFRMTTTPLHLQTIQDMPFDGSFTLLANPDAYICYINAVIHSLCMILPLVRFLGNKCCFEELNCTSNQNNYVQEGGQVVTAAHRLIRQVFSRIDRVNPGPFKDALDRDSTMKQFQGVGQHCALDFFIAFIDRIHDATKNDDGASLVKDLFEVDFSSTTKLQCGNETCHNNQQSNKQEPSNTCIAVPVVSAAGVEFKHFDSCLSEFFSEQVELKCNACKTSGRAEKINKITNLPHILVVALKVYDGEGNKRDVDLDGPVDGLNLAGYSDVANSLSTEYDLFAVIKHLSLLQVDGSGHYISLLRCGDRWLEYDDLKDGVISRGGTGLPMTSKEVYKDAYLLLFCRSDLFMSTIGQWVQEKSNQCLRRRQTRGTLVRQNLPR